MDAFDWLMAEGAYDMVGWDGEKAAGGGAQIRHLGHRS